MNKQPLKILFLGFVVLINNLVFSQITTRERPKEWENLVQGARFIDRFLPMEGKVVATDTWGAKGVASRYVDNGIEDRIWSYWCGSIKQADNGKYHMFVCGWLETSPKGHYEWPNSYVFDAVGDSPAGPFVPKTLIGKGHNAEAFRMKDKRYVLYVINGRYVADSITGPWKYGKFDFNSRDRNMNEDLSNLSFAQREDSSYLMVSRGGMIWISETGLSEYGQLTEKRVYPDVEGRFEDPVIWRDHIQYHLIVNDWLGRRAFYLRSKDGIKWVVDPGEAYMPGIARHKDGTVEEWFKFERMRVFQDNYGRVIQANFAVVDLQKEEDKGGDNHSSKNITIPLNPGLLLTILDTKPIAAKTKEIRVKIQAETGFNPQTDIDLSSLRFGASTEVNYGRGCKVSKVENADNDLIVTFNATGNGITEDEFAPKLIGHKKTGELLYGYARLPYIDYIEPILSAKAPVCTKSDKGDKWTVEVQNFGQVMSKQVFVKIEYSKNGSKTMIASGVVPPLKPYRKIVLDLQSKKSYEKEEELTVTIFSGKKIWSVFTQIRK